MDARKSAAAQKTVWMYGDNGRFWNLYDIAGEPLVPWYHGHEAPNGVPDIYFAVLPPLQRDRNDDAHRQANDNHRYTEKKSNAHER